MKPVPVAAVLARRRGKAGKSTARMAQHVITIRHARYASKAPCTAEGGVTTAAAARRRGLAARSDTAAAARSSAATSCAAASGRSIACGRSRRMRACERALKPLRGVMRTASGGAASVAMSRAKPSAPERGAPASDNARRSARPAGAAAHSSAHSAALVPTRVLAKLRSERRGVSGCNDGERNG